jgi:hypothetical protein
VYLPDAEFEPAALRQGDVVADLQLFGAINPNVIRSLRDADDNLVGWQVNAAPDVGYGVVLSHSCEIEPENSIKVTSVILAPLRDVSTATREDRIQELKDSNIITEETHASYLKYFYLDPHPRLPFRGGAIADFSKCFSIRNKFYEKLVERKVLQLQRAVSGAMALKLALYFSRP